ncbi:hypothetical protein HMSSN139_18460 [Paenibacillus sp. HMSSN-139]|nr:hypothetical protein HMSSN139_18460 [Paenibacillus sp. HMSSN-139]
MIRNMARLNDTESVKRFTEYLAKYYQFMTRRESGDVRLAEEVEHSRVYADIQKCGSARGSRSALAKFRRPPRIGLCRA